MISSLRPRFAEQDFRKATASNPNMECVRVARRDGWAEIRDDKVPFGSPEDHRITVTAEEFDTFQDGLRSNHTQDLPLRLDLQPDGTYALRARRGSSATLTFTQAEMAAFIDGIRKREFDLSQYPQAEAC
jgi:hypothetical protein